MWQIVLLRYCEMCNKAKNHKLHKGTIEKRKFFNLNCRDKLKICGVNFEIWNCACNIDASTTKIFTFDTAKDNFKQG
jgi:hypothetical protein